MARQLTNSLTYAPTLASITGVLSGTWKRLGQRGRYVSHWSIIATPGCQYEHQRERDREGERDPLLPGILPQRQPPLPSLPNHHSNSPNHHSNSPNHHSIPSPNHHSTPFPPTIPSPPPTTFSGLVLCLIVFGKTGKSSFRLLLPMRVYFTLSFNLYILHKPH